MISPYWNDLANRVVRRPGAPLPSPQREFFERGFGRSLDAIRLHVDPNATAAVGAEAFAVGRHIVLREVPTDWNAPAIRYLLGHEITHCLQQKAISDAAPVAALGGADDSFETEAHQAAVDLLAGRKPARLSQEKGAVVRRVISVAPGTVNLIVHRSPKEIPAQQAYREARTITPGSGKRGSQPTMEPGAAPPPYGAVATYPTMFFDAEPFHPIGVAAITGAVDEDLSGNELGFIQVLRESNWGVYRGRRKEDGSMLLERSGAGRQRSHVCRDTLDPSGVMVDLKNDEQGYTTPSMKVPQGTKVAKAGDSYFLVCRFEDAPHEAYDLMLTNTKTKQPNFLNEAHIFLEFCTVLVLRSPNGRFEPLKHVFWNVLWHFAFDPPDLSQKPNQPFGMTPPPRRLTENRLPIGKVQNGGPTDKHFSRLLNATAAPNCNKEGELRVRAVRRNAPGQAKNTREEKTWVDFEVERRSP